MHLTGAGIFFSWFECCTSALAQIDKEKANVAASHDRERKREALHTVRVRERKRDHHLSLQKRNLCYCIFSFVLFWGRISFVGLCDSECLVY
jgi:hypothetical protein